MQFKTFLASVFVAGALAVPALSGPIGDTPTGELLNKGQKQVRDVAGSLSRGLALDPSGSIPGTFRRDPVVEDDGLLRRAEPEPKDKGGDKDKDKDKDKGKDEKHGQTECTCEKKKKQQPHDACRKKTLIKPKSNHTSPIGHSSSHQPTHEPTHQPGHPAKRDVEKRAEHLVENGQCRTAGPGDGLYTGSLEPCTGLAAVGPKFSKVLAHIDPAHAKEQYAEFKKQAQAIGATHVAVSSPGPKHKGDKHKQGTKPDPSTDFCKWIHDEIHNDFGKKHKKTPRPRKTVSKLQIEADNHVFVTECTK